MRYQISASVGDGPMQPGRVFEEMGNKEGFLTEFRESLEWEELAAQQSADYTRKPVCIEVRDTEKNYLIAHKRFTPRTLLQ